VLPRSGRVDGGVDHARAALALGEPRAAPVRSGWAEATQRGRGNGGKVVRKRGRGMKICRVKYYVDFGGFFIEKRAYAPLRWNHLEHEVYIYPFAPHWEIPMLKVEELLKFVSIY
jgi:hypothetical protein